MVPPDHPSASPAVLLVEDNPDDAHLLELEFEDAGIGNELVVVGDGDVALRYLRRLDPFEDVALPGLVLLDLHLPKVDGHEVLQIVDGDPALGGIPIVVVSVPTELEWVSREYGHVIAGVLPKPVTIQELTVLVAGIEGLGSSFLVRR